jgi:hypothetical protein
MTAPGDEPKNASGRKKPGKIVHAHDEFEVDISVDTKAGLPEPSEILPDLFADTVEGSDEESTQVLDLTSDLPPPPKASRTESQVTTSLGEDVLPVFVPFRNGTKTPMPGTAKRVPEVKAKPPAKGTPPPARSTPSPAKGTPPPARSTPPPARRTTPPPARSARPAGSVPPAPAPFKAVVEDLSSGVFERPGNPKALDLALDELAVHKPVSAGGPLPGPGEVSDPALEPLDIRQFDMSTGQSKKKTGSSQRTGTTDFRGEPLRSPTGSMAQSRRVVRTVFTFGTREILILVLIVLLGAALWVGWIIYQDYSRQLDLDRAEQFRTTLQQVKDSALDEKKVKPKERDIP